LTHILLPFRYILWPIRYILWPFGIVLLIWYAYFMTIWYFYCQFGTYNIPIVVCCI
jgi:hypothetical protein